MEKIKLGEVVDIISGYAFKASEFKRTGVPVIRISDLDGNKVTISDNTARIDEADIDEKYLLKKGDLLIGLSGSIGKIGVFSSDELAYLNQRVGKVIAKEGISEDFAVYLINNLVNLMKKDSVGGTVLNISPTTIKNYEVYLPNKDEQDFISKKLKTIEILIQTRQDQIQALDDLVESTFFEMFGDLGRPNYEVKKIKDVAKSTQYGTSKKADDKIGEFPILRMGNITQKGDLDLTDLKYIDIDDDEESKYLVEKGEILFNRTNSRELVGKTALYNLDEKMAYAGYLIKLNVKEIINPLFLVKQMNMEFYKKLLFTKAKSSIGMANINSKELLDFKIIFPSIEKQNQFAAFVEKIEKQKQILNDSLGDLTNLFDSLMQDAFDGSMTK